jgi:hypothetical protein
MEPPGGEIGNNEHTWGMYNKPTGCSTPAYGAPHRQTNKQTSCYHGEADRPILLPTPDHHNTRLDIKNEDVANIISHCFPPGCRLRIPSAQYNTFT